jgi:hypothetical protein
MTGEVSHMAIEAGTDKRISRMSHHGELRLDAHRYTEHKRHHCPHCGAKTQTFILAESAWLDDELVHVSQSRCCWQCGGVVSNKPDLINVLLDSVRKSWLCDGLSEVAVATGAFRPEPTRVVLPKDGGFECLDYCGVDSTGAQGFRAAHVQTIEEAIEFLNEVAA